jgi:Fe2+ or Zn2+ uptake regulation protein
MKKKTFTIIAENGKRTKVKATTSRKAIVAYLAKKHKAV